MRATTITLRLDIARQVDSTPEQKEFALSTIYRFKTYWENFEESKLLADRDALIQERKDDAENFTEEVINGFIEK